MHYKMALDAPKMVLRKHVLISISQKVLPDDISLNNF